MLPVEFKKRPCRPVEFEGQGPYRESVSWGGELSLFRGGFPKRPSVYSHSVYMALFDGRRT